MRRLWIEKASDIDARVLLLDHVRPRRQAAAVHAHDRGRHGDRAGRGRAPRRARAAAPRPARRLQPWFVRRSLLRPAIPQGRAQAGRRDHRARRTAVPRARRHAGRDQPADRDAATASVRALDAKVTIDDNALFRHPDIDAMRDVEAADPQEQMARERGVTYVKLDGTVGILGNGAGLVMSTLDVVAQAGGTPANFLDVGGGAQADEIVDGARGDPLRHKVQVDPVQHLRRHHALRRGRARASSRRSSSSSHGADRRAARRHVRRGGPQAAGRRRAAERDGRDARCSTRRAAAVELAGKAARSMAIIVSRGHAARRAGHHRPRGRVPRDPQPRLRHEGRRRRHARQGRSGRGRHPGLRHGRRGRRARGREHVDGLRAAALRGRRDLRGGRRRRRTPIVCIAEGIPAHEMLDVYRYVRARGVRLLGPELPRRALAGHRERRHHPGARLHSRARSGSSRARAR